LLSILFSTYLQGKRRVAYIGPLRISGIKRRFFSKSIRLKRRAL
uniref:Envelope glycoprotein n=1 Tax=Anisakis simplex TaxID=6269 RepID=A0A0M3J758_ANISI